MTVVYNTNFTHNPNSYLTLAVQRAAEAMFGATNVAVADNRNLIELAAAGQHATLICLDGQRLNRSMLERVRPAFATTILWLFEDPFMLKYNQSHVDLFDFIFTNDPGCAASYGTKGHYLPLGASDSLHFRALLPDDQLDYDIFFAGTMWPNRVGTIRGLLDSFPDKKFKLVCPTNPYLPPLPRVIAARAIQWPVSHESFVDFANASRVVLTMFRDYASHGDVSQAAAPGPRLFELGLAGTAQVAEIDDDADADNFNIVDGVVCSNDLPGLITEISSILADPALRHDRAATAQRSIMDGHLYQHRLERIAAVAGADFAKAPVLPLAPEISARRRRVLMCSHSTMHEQEWGGVEVYQQILATALAGSIEVFYWLRRNQTCTLLRSDGLVLDQFSVPEVGWVDCLSDAPEEVAFANIIAQYEIDLVHFQHLGHHAASLPIIAKSAGAGTVLSVHDFFIVCSRYNLLDYDMKFCDIGNRTITACDICLKIAEGVEPGGQETRRAFFGEMLRSVDVLLFGTAYSHDLSLRIYPHLKDKRREVIGIPTPADVRAAPPARPLRSADAPLKVAVVGNFLRSKGADTVLRVIETVEPSLFEFRIIGKAEAVYEQVLLNSKRPNVSYGGRYGVGQLDAVAECDVAIFMSIWPETFCISLSEAWQRGVVPIVTKLGALGDRVVHGENGFIVNVSDAAAVIGYLDLLRANPVLLDTLRGNVTPGLWTGLGDYTAAILDIYRSVTPRKRLGVTTLGFDLGHVHLLPHPTWRTPAPARHIFDPPRRADIELDMPFDITGWIEGGGKAHVDSVADNLVAKLEAGTFQSSDRLDLTGWAFVPGLGLSGQVAVALLGTSDEGPIFIKAVRQFRHDITSVFPGSPNQTGFSAQTVLRGKWSNGHYQVAVINAVGKRAAFTLTSLSLTLRDGSIVDAALRPNTPKQVLSYFEQMIRPPGLSTPRLTPDLALPHGAAPPRLAPLEESLPPLPPAFRLADVQVAPHQRLHCHFDDIGDGDPVGEQGGPIIVHNLLHLRGWVVQRPLTVQAGTVAGELYFALLDASGIAPAFGQAIRQSRPDIGKAIPGAPELAGFTVDLAVPGDTVDGVCRLICVHVVDGVAAVDVSPLEFVIRDGAFVAVMVNTTDIAADNAMRLQLIEDAQKSRVPMSAGKVADPDLSEANLAGVKKRRARRRA